MRRNFKNALSVLVEVSLTIIAIILLLLNFLGSLIIAIFVGIIVGVIIIGVIIFFPFLSYIPFIQNFAMYMYELEMEVLKILRMAEFDTAIKYGWMTEKEIFNTLRQDTKGEINKFHLKTILEKLSKEEAVLRSEKVPVAYLKDPPTKYGFTVAYKIENDSNYKPKKPKFLPKKQKTKTIDGVAV